MVPAIRDLRNALGERGMASETTERFQDDLLHYAEAFAPHGNCLVEVGSFRGGISAQFAAVAARLGLECHILDINPQYLEIARQAVEEVAGVPNVYFHRCGFPAFALTADADIRPALVLIDGNHRYDQVIADIRALFVMRGRPHAAAFHDYSLRYAPRGGTLGRISRSMVRVDRALADMLGENFAHVPIGETARENGELRLRPEDDDHYHALGSSEGVLIELAKVSPISRVQSWGRLASMVRRSFQDARGAAV